LTHSFVGGAKLGLTNKMGDLAKAIFAVMSGSISPPKFNRSRQLILSGELTVANPKPENLSVL